MRDWNTAEGAIASVTRLLAEANRAAATNAALKEIARPLVEAIEQLPDAGRIAVFRSVAPFATYSLVAAPSFSNYEISALWAAVETRDLDRPVREQPVSIDVRKPDAAGALLQVFPLSMSWRPPALVIVSVHEAQSPARAPRAFGRLIDELVQLSNLVFEDRVLREMVTEERSVFDALMRTAPDAIIRIDAQGTILDFIGASERIFGYAASDVRGHNIACLMPEPHASRHDDYIRAYLETGERKLPDFGRRLEARRRDGTLISVEIALSEVKGPKRSEFIGTVRDISQRVRREQESEQLRRALEEAGRQSALGELAASVAHEINQPLTSVANYLDALDLRLAAGEQDRDVLRDLAARAAREARFGGEIVRRLRSMVTVGEVDFAFADFHEAVREAVEIIRHATGLQGGRVDLCQEGGEASGLFDRVQVQQVVLNLASNALTAMESSPVRRLAVTSRALPGRFELEVADTGPGIPETEKGDVFRSFFKRADGGMGLGLAIVSRIADMHEGEASVHDNPGGGALFRFAFPRNTRPDESEER